MSAKTASPEEVSLIELDAVRPSVKQRKSPRVQYKFTLSSAEHEQLIDLRDRCRSAGHSVSKTALLRAAIAVINQQSSVAIAEQLQQLPSLRKPRKSTGK